MKTEMQPSGVFDGVEVYYVPGFEGFYSVSKCGRVWSHERIVPFRGGSRTIEGRWRKPCTSSYDKRFLFHLFIEGEKFQLSAHRIVAMTFMDGFKESDVLDHIDKNSRNNHIENLRIVTRSQNRLNSKMRSDNSSGFRGVNWNIKMEMWVARIGVRNKRQHLGFFESRGDAALAYDEAARILHGEFAELNFPQKKESRVSPKLLAKVGRLKN